MDDPTKRDARRPHLERRLLAFWQRARAKATRLSTEDLEACAGGTVAPTRPGKCAWLSTDLMAVFKSTGDPEAIALLFELNQAAFLETIRSTLRQRRSAVDANDVLQEAFLNILRYPHGFVADRADAFERWGHRIARNTVMKEIRKQARQPDTMFVDEVDMEHADERAAPPEHIAAQHEAARLVNLAFVLFLALYLRSYRRLSAKTKTALCCVELEGKSYRETAQRLGIPVPHLKMVLLRGRRRILRGMAQALTELESTAGGEGQEPPPRREQAPQRW